MAMEGQQEYPAMLAQLQPPQAVSILHDRVNYIGKLNAAIAGWLQVHFPGSIRMHGN